MAANTLNNILKKPVGNWLSIIAAGVVIVAVMAQPVKAESFKEYQVKAVFLYNLVNFVDWPEISFSDPHSAFTIGILGENPFGMFLDRTVENEKFGGRPIKVVRYTQAEELLVRRCQILFVSAGQSDSWKKARSNLKTSPVLTVADHSGFTRQGGMINLRKLGNRIHVEINLENTRDTGLVISAKLLNLARLVEPSQKP